MLRSTDSTDSHPRTKILLGLGREQKQKSEDCNPKLDVVFQKTHKCGGSTIQNILFRYALAHELNVVLPNSGNFFGGPYLFKASYIKGTPWQMAGLHYHMFCLHNRWNGKEVEKIMGKTHRPLYFTILRDPVELYRYLLP